MDNKFLMQEEIDALFNNNQELGDLADLVEERDPAGTEAVRNSSDELSSEEIDVLGEIGNISMGSAATTLSQLLNQKVLITSPRVKVCTQESLFSSFDIPYMAIEVDYTQGLEGLNLLIMKVADASLVADMMMGGDGNNVKSQLTEFEMSAAAEAMNQMIGSSATSMSQVFSLDINISPPRAKAIEIDMKDYAPFDKEEKIVVVSFDMSIGDIVNTEIMQIMAMNVAKSKVKLLLQNSEGDVQEELIAPLEEEPIAEISKEIPKEKYNSTSTILKDTPNVLIDKKYELILDIPLKVSVVLGKSRKSLAEVLRLAPGSIVELDKVLDDDVDILVNGTLVAKGEVVVVDENFGVRIKNIITPSERMNYIK